LWGTRQKENLERTRRRGEDDIKKYIKLMEWEGVGCINLTPVRGQVSSTCEYCNEQSG
jgi:ribosomal protein S13